MTDLSSPGDTFPALDLNLVGGDALHLPDCSGGRRSVVIFNRGSWCPFCNARLRGFQRPGDQLAALDAGVVSLSVDDEPTMKVFTTLVPSSATPTIGSARVAGADQALSPTRGSERCEPGSGPRTEGCGPASPVSRLNGARAAVLAAWRALE